MVTEAILNVLASVFTWFLVQIPAPAPPEFFASAKASIEAFAPTVSAITVWQPVPLIALVVGAWVVTWALGVGVRLLRMIMSLFSGGGGSAA